MKYDSALKSLLQTSKIYSSSNRPLTDFRETPFLAARRTGFSYPWRQNGVDRDGSRTGFPTPDETAFGKVCDCGLHGTLGNPYQIR